MDNPKTPKNRQQFDLEEQCSLNRKRRKDYLSLQKKKNSNEASANINTNARTPLSNISNVLHDRQSNSSTKPLNRRDLVTSAGPSSFKRDYTTDVSTPLMFPTTPSPFPPSLGDVYYLRVLLNHVKGATSFEDIRTVNGRLFETYKEACEELGLLANNKEYVEAINEASTWATASHLRSFFVMLLISNSLSHPFELWCKTWKILSEDIQHRQRIMLNMPGLILDEDELKNLCLSRIEELLRNNGTSLTEFPEMPNLNDDYLLTLTNRLIRQELLYDKDSLKEEHESYKRSLTNEQNCVYEIVLEAANETKGEFSLSMDMVERERHFFGRL